MWPNPSIERTFQSLLRSLWPAAHVERWTSRSGAVPSRREREMDPLFRTLFSAVAVIVSFFVAVLCGRLIAVRTTREKNAQQLVTAFAALAIFLVLFFAGRRLLSA